MAITKQFKVVVNHEEQYSIWPAESKTLTGWKDVGKTGPLEECIRFIEEVWTDNRPPDLRQRLQTAARTGGLARFK